MTQFGVYPACARWSFFHSRLAKVWIYSPEKWFLTLKMFADKIQSRAVKNDVKSLALKILHISH